MSKARKAKASEVTPEEGEEVTASESGTPSEAREEALESETEQANSVEGDSPAPGEQIASLRDEVADLKDQLLRKQADFENFRKRLLREREDAIRYANTGLLLDLVGTVDNFERAIKSSAESKDFETFYTGIDMIEKQLTSMLDSKYGLQRFESAGEEFNPEFHEAITAEESTEVTTQTVIDDLQKGYMLHDRVLRPAKVRVAMPAEEKPAESTENEEPGE
jgi:molecular chaperone GrpE